MLIPNPCGETGIVRGTCAGFGDSREVGVRLADEQPRSNGQVVWGTVRLRQPRQPAVG